MNGSAAGSVTQADVVLADVLRGGARPIALMLDFDGTLADFAPTPAVVELPPARVRLLRELAGLPEVRLAFVSGRRLDDLKDRVAVRPAYFAGLHGLEIDGPAGERFRHPALAQAAGLMVGMANVLAGHLARPGVWIEYKGSAVAVHWRQASEEDAAAARAEVDRFLAHPAHAAQVRRLDGNAVCELLPRTEWDKGAAVHWILQRLAGAAGPPPRPVVIGDDWTDEAAFAAVGDTGVTICVGDRPSVARHRVRSPDEVHALLERLAAAITSTRRCIEPGQIDGRDRRE